MDVLIDGLVGLALEGNGHDGLRRLTASIDGPTCREVIKTLEILEAKKEPPEEFLRRDREQNRRNFSVKERIGEMIESKSFDPSASVNASFLRLVKREQRKSGRLMIDLAARAFELEKGRRPQDAKELVPEYLKAVPKDPTTGADLALPR